MRLVLTLLVLLLSIPAVLFAQWVPRIPGPPPVPGLPPISGGSVLAGRLVGTANVIDGDTIEIHGKRIRLHGIDAPESNQTCEADGKPYRCGQQAALALADKIGRKTVTCEPRGKDRYGRVVAVCSLNGRDLQAWLVAEGWALAYRRYSMDYVDEEEAAKEAKRGIWRGRFVKPWEWRQGKRMDEAAEATPSRGCTVKGNISSNGERIYHVRGGRDYERTKISTEKGERWFCSEREAVAAGWRAVRR